ncbi:hypothetical protein RvY_15051 [Ramazzottius varieornatus]|uniref:Peptidase M12A domain-containing protein n=1 Tax=Ramazzottius varieornatus TaxID=947166 RepID=A0A1D1VUW9_RAMVA|nr:hypothetical protein RvY_15051 [Ramazzottius varieornatus]
MERSNHDRWCSDKIHFLALVILSVLPTLVKGAVLGSDQRFTLWPNPSRIPYQLQANHFNNQDISTLNAAMNQISSDTGGCIRFQPFSNATDRNRLIRNNGFGQVAVIFGSKSYPGAVTDVGEQSRAGALPGACLDTQRDTMRILMNLLGIRNEHNRQDRNNFLLFQSAVPNMLVAPSLQKYNLFAAYANNSIATIASTFDYKSVTLVSGEQFAKSRNRPVFIPAYAASGSVLFNPPTSFSKHLYCPPLISSSSLPSPVVIGDVTISNAPGVNFRFQLIPSVSYLSVISSTGTILGTVLPAARILLTQIPSRGFVNGQFTLIAMAGALQGSTILTITINCLPNFVSSTGGPPLFTPPSPIFQPVTYLTPPGNNRNPGIFVNCKDSNDILGAATYLPSPLGFVTAVDPEGGRISYYINAPFADVSFDRAYSVTSDGVIVIATNNNPNAVLGIQGQFPYQGTLGAVEENVYVAAVDSAGGISILHYKVFTQCAPPA